MPLDWLVALIDGGHGRSAHSGAGEPKNSWWQRLGLRAAFSRPVAICRAGNRVAVPCRRWTRGWRQFRPGCTGRIGTVRDNPQRTLTARPAAFVVSVDRAFPSSVRGQAGN